MLVFGSGVSAIIFRGLPLHPVHIDCPSATNLTLDSITLQAPLALPPIRRCVLRRVQASFPLVASVVSKCRTSLQQLHLSSTFALGHPIEVFARYGTKNCGV